METVIDLADAHARKRDKIRCKKCIIVLGESKAVLRIKRWLHDILFLIDEIHSISLFVQHGVAYIMRLLWTHLATIDCSRVQLFDSRCALTVLVGRSIAKLCAAPASSSSSSQSGSGRQDRRQWWATWSFQSGSFWKRSETLLIPI